MKTGDYVIIVKDRPSGTELRKGRKVKVKRTSFEGDSIVVEGNWWLSKDEVFKVPNYFKNDK